MLKEALTLIALTLTPFFELRASIPFGILAGIPLPLVLIITILSNIALAPLLYIFLNYVIHIFLKINAINKIWQKIVTRTQKKVHPYVEKYGTLSLALFIAVPLPGSGVYSGSIAAYLLGYEFKEFLIASIIGVILAATAVTIITLFGKGIWLYTIQ
jgi:uncharacterized membrane protein